MPSVHRCGAHARRWIEETWGEAAKGVLGQLLFFYTLMLIGFACILLLARSTSK